MTEESVNVVEEKTVNAAIGRELRRVRESLGLKRLDVVKRLSSNISVQTLANYEYGIRPCTLARIVEICEALDVPASALVEIALQRAGIESESGNIRVDLDVILSTPGDRYAYLRHWARNRRQRDPGSDIVRLGRATIDEMAAIFGYSPYELMGHLRSFMPPRVPCRIAWELST